MCVIDLEPCTVWREKEVTARKEHVCSCCDGSIQPGERYIVHFSVFEGEATSEKMCMPCLAIRADFKRIHRTQGTPGSMRSLLDDCLMYDDGETVVIDDAELNTSAMWRKALDEMSARRDKRATKMGWG